MSEEGRSKIFWVVLALCLTVLLGGGLWWGRPAYRSFKEQRAVTRATAFMEENDGRNAVLSLRQALALNPANIEAIGLMAALAESTRSPQVLAWRKRAAELDPSVENQLLLTAAALRVESPPFPIATSTLTTLAPIGETNAAYHLLASQLALRLNRPADAVRHLENAAQIEPTNQLHQLNLATLRLQSCDWAIAEMARAQLLALADITNYSAVALRSLVSDALAREKPGEAHELVTRLLDQGQAGFSDHLLQLTVLHKARAPGLESAVEATREAASSNTSDILSTVAWMVGHDHAVEAMGWIQSLPLEVQEQPVILLARAECYLGAKDWSGLELWLEAQDWAQQECVRLTLLSKALREQGRIEMADANWRRAVGSAGKQPQALATLSRLAAVWEWDHELESLLWSAARDVTRNDWAFRALGGFYQSRTNTPGLYRLHKALLEKEPQLVMLQNNTAMIALLLDRDLDQARAMAQRVYETSKTNAIFVSTYAYALHLQGQTDEALELMQSLSEDQLQHPPIALYQAVLLQAAGRTEQARRYAAAARQAPLMLPEEAALIESLKP